MKVDAPPVELVTLSDSLTSPVLKPKIKSRTVDQGSTMVVCLDSDTESDGSFVHTMGATFKAFNTGTSRGLSDECKKQSDNWLGLHKCSKQSKCWGASHSKPNVDHMDLRACHGSENVAKCSSYSPLSSPDQGFCYADSYSYNVTGYSVSPCTEVRSISLSVTKKAEGVDLPENHGLHSSLPSKEWDDCSSPAWDDHLNGNISILDTSEVVVQLDTSSKQFCEQDGRRDYSDHESDDTNYRDYLFLKNKLRKCDAGDTTVSGDHDKKRNSSKKSTKRGSSGADREGLRTTEEIVGLSKISVTDKDNSTDALDKELENLTRKGKQTKDREEREARKQQLMVEREILRQQKQEEKKRLQELKKRRNEEEKKRKEELKAEAVERRKVEKEKEKWEKGKFALQNITALVDTQILEAGLIGGHLLTRFAEKGFKYHLVKNPVKKTVLWQMKLPSKESLVDSHEDCLSQDCQEPKTLKNSGAQLSLESVDVSYVLVVLEANEFLEMITRETLDEHIRNLQELYPGVTLCYLINKLIWSLQRREQKQYKSPGDNWIRPPVEQVQKG